MKKVIITISIMIGLCGCMRPQYHYTNNFIAGYYQYSDNAYAQVDEVNQIGFIFGKYTIDLIGYYNKEEYSVYAEKFGDTYYNRKVDIVTQRFPSNVTALGFVVTSIDVVSNNNWNDTHAAGTSLAQYFSVRFRSIAKFIDSGYDFNLLESCKNSYHNIPLDQLQNDNMRLVIAGHKAPSFHICATSPPTIDKQHRLTITLTLDDGTTREHIVDITYP